MSVALTNDAGQSPACRMRVRRYLGVSSWQGRLLLVLVLFGPAWLLDRPVAERNPRQFGNQIVKKCLATGRQFGEPFCAIWLVLAVSFIDPSRRRPMVLTLVAVMYAGLLGTCLKLAVGRERPDVSEGRTVIRGPQWPGAMRPDPSFPSGHTASAFALAYGMSRVFGRGRGVFIVLAASCGVSRFLGETHFLTDVLAGALLGWESARMLWEWGLTKLIRWIDRLIPAFSWYPRWDWDATVD